MLHQSRHERIFWLTRFRCRPPRRPGEQIAQREPELPLPVNQRPDPAQQVLAAQTDETRDQLGQQRNNDGEDSKDEDEPDNCFQDDVIHRGFLRNAGNGPTVIAAADGWIDPPTVTTIRRRSASMRRAAACCSRQRRRCVRRTVIGQAWPMKPPHLNWQVGDRDAPDRRIWAVSYHSRPARFGPPGAAGVGRPTRLTVAYRPAPARTPLPRRSTGPAMPARVTRSNHGRFSNRR